MPFYKIKIFFSSLICKKTPKLSYYSEIIKQFCDKILILIKFPSLACRNVLTPTQSSGEVVGRDELIEDEFAANDETIEEPEMIEDELIEDEFANEEEEDAILQD